jgi:hypothetical protein
MLARDRSICPTRWVAILYVGLRSTLSVGTILLILLSGRGLASVFDVTLSNVQFENNYSLSGSFEFQQGIQTSFEAIPNSSSVIIKNPILNVSYLLPVIGFSISAPNLQIDLFTPNVCARLFACATVHLTTPDIFSGILNGGSAFVFAQNVFTLDSFQSGAKTVAPTTGSASHMVDGVFGASEWTASAANGSPARATVTENSFNADGPNAAFLYVEQSNNGTPVSGGGVGNRLDLMYDFVGGSAAAPFDVLFQVPSTQTDYAVEITPSGSLTAFEKPTGATSGLNPDGSLNLNSAPWSPLDADDLALANFLGAVGFGPSPNSSTPHPIAEFELSVDTSNGQGAPNGLYGSGSAFWSASAFSGEFGTR